MPSFHHAKLAVKSGLDLWDWTSGIGLQFGRGFWKNGENVAETTMVIAIVVRIRV